MTAYLHNEPLACAEDLAVQLQMNEEANAINRSRPVKRLCAAAHYGNDGQVVTWYDPQGTRASCFEQLGIPGDEIDPPYALAIYRDKRWHFDEASHPLLRLSLEKYIESEPWSQSDR